MSATNTFSRAYGIVNEAMTHVIINTESPGIFNIMVTGVRKDKVAREYSETEEKAEFKIK